MSIFGGLGNLATGGEQSNESSSEQQAIQDLANVAVPTAEELDLPALQQYAAAQQMTPAQMQAYLQQNNALADEDTSQTGTAAQVAALNQLANTANQGATGNATEQAQESQILNNENEQVAGQRGAINQAAESQGVPLGLLQAALATTDEGQDAQAANQAALTAQSNNYQTALQALANEGTTGANLQGQENTQANAVAAAQNAMQQFNAANQQEASQGNASLQQQANATNTAANNQVQQANTGLANQQTEYNAQVPETIFGNQLSKAQGEAQQQQNQTANEVSQGNTNAGIAGALTGASGSFLGISPTGGGSPFSGGSSSAGGTSGTAAINSGAGSTPAAGSANALPSTYGIGGAHGGIVPSYAQGGITDAIGPILSMLMAEGGVVPKMSDGGLTGGFDGYCEGGMTMKAGGMIPGKAKVPGDSKVNDTVPIRVSPGEAVVPRTVVQQHPIDVMRLLRGQPASQPQQQPQTAQQGHDPRDVAALLAAMKHMRGGGR